MRSAGTNRYSLINTHDHRSYQELTPPEGHVDSEFGHQTYFDRYVHTLYRRSLRSHELAHPHYPPPRSHEDEDNSETGANSMTE